MEKNGINKNTSYEYKLKEIKNNKETAMNLLSELGELPFFMNKKQSYSLKNVLAKLNRKKEECSKEQCRLLSIYMELLIWECDRVLNPSFSGNIKEAKVEIHSYFDSFYDRFFGHKTSFYISDKKILLNFEETCKALNSLPV